ncbi:MAG: hypothetical protein M1816_006975, partial [Peltula sp. TS41687]
MVSAMSLAPLAIALFVTTTAAIPAPAPGVTDLSAAAGISHSRIIVSDQPPPGLELGGRGGHSETNVTFPADGTDGNSFSKRDVIDKRGLYSFLNCDYDASYNLGPSTFWYWSHNLCKSLTANGDYTWPTNPAGPYAYMTVYLGKSMKMWNNVFLTIHQASGIATLTQAQCYSGFEAIIDYAIHTPECQGYSGHNYGDMMGNFNGGGVG